MAMETIIEGYATLQYVRQLIGYLFFSATATPTTLAEAPIGVPLPPMSVPNERDHAMGFNSRPVITERSLMRGAIVAAKGTLSTKEERKADIHNIMPLSLIHI